MSGSKDSVNLPDPENYPLPIIDLLNESVRSAEELIDNLSEMLSAARRGLGSRDTSSLVQAADPLNELDAGFERVAPTDVQAHNVSPPGDRAALSAVKTGGTEKSCSSTASPTPGVVLRETGGGPAVNATPAASSSPRFVTDAITTSAAAGSSSAVDLAPGAPRRRDICSLCQLLISGSDFVDCEGCHGSFHANTRCLGIQQDEIIVLLKKTSGALFYRCCICRSGKTGAVGAISQIMGMIGALVQSDKSRRHSDGVCSNAYQERSSGSSNVLLRDEVMTHVRELR